MLPHEFNMRVSLQHQVQTVQRLQFDAWCRVANYKLAELPSSLRFEVRIDAFGFNHIHVSTVELEKHSERTFHEIVTHPQNRRKLWGTWGQLMTWEILQYLGSDEANALYELELLAGAA